MRPALTTVRQPLRRLARLSSSVWVGVLAGVLALLCGSMAPAWAGQPLPPGVDAQRLHQFTAGLRCLVCQNESLADSNAPLAQDLKREIAERMAAGQSEAQIEAFLVARYGDFVRYRPPLAPRTWLLWLGPLLLLGVGAAVLVHRHHRPGVAPLAQPLGDPLDD